MFYAFALASSGVVHVFVNLTSGTLGDFVIFTMSGCVVMYCSSPCTFLDLAFAFDHTLLFHFGRRKNPGY